ncbi:MAG: hypothetical protein ACK4MV_21095 [Beijerinckiaceae bacterium]
MIRLSHTLLAVAAFLLPSSADAQTQRMGRCHMGECGWTREISRDFVGTSPRGYLVRLELLRGTSTNPRGGPARNRPIKWEKKPEETFVFCSKTLPAVMFTLDGEFSVHLLDLYPKGNIPGYQEASLALYMDVCHNVNVHRKYEDPQAYVERFKYDGERARYVAVEKAVKLPMDILKQ